MSAPDQTAVDTLRTLSIDMVQAANSGHPGLPLGAAPMAYTVFRRILKFNPSDPDWFDRDRFILSAGHGSALVYSLLHLFGYDLSLDELKNFRQIGSKTPGHPENFMTKGIECTTGPLGQGFATGVGMAIAESWLAARYNQGGAKVVDHFTYAIVSDGDLMEGVAMEAASLAGHLGLGKLIYLYDSNDISLDGPCSLSFGEDTAKKFEAVNWHVQTVEDGNDLDAIESAILAAQKVTDKPSLVIVKTIIGYASPLAGSSKSHGSPLGPENVAKTKEALSWPHTEPFTVPDEVKAVADEAKTRGEQAQTAWQNEFAKLEAARPDLAQELKTIQSGNLPADWQKALDELTFEGGVATRDAGGKALNAIAENLPWLVGGAADLAGSTKTHFNDSTNFAKDDHSGRNLYYGVREHAMGAIVNGLCLHGLRGFGSTFLVFSDYMRGAVRLSALSRLNAFHVFTHDSVFVGEDGPTHQPIEHVAALRLIPGLEVWRPADAYETVESWREVISAGKASAIVETRQNLPALNDHRDQIRKGSQKGAYVLHEPAEQLRAILVATGSEVDLALKSAAALQNEGIPVRVVSMPCRERFEDQPATYQNTILPPDLPCVSIEAGVTQGWGDIVGRNGRSIGIDRYGESGPGEKVYAHLGMTIDAVVQAVKDLAR